MYDILNFSVPTPYPVGPVNLYLVKSGETNVLIDTGPYTEEAKEAFIENLKKFGLTPGDIHYIIITHAHQDHMGLARWIKSQSGAKICTHIRNVYWITNYPGELERQRKYFKDFWRKNGVPEEIIRRMELYWNFFKDHSKSTSVDCFIEKDSLFMVEGAELELNYTPGHAIGHISVKIDDKFISGDHLLLDITSNPVIEPPLPGETERPLSLPLYLNSLEKTLTIEGIKEVLPGHGTPFKNHKKVIKQKIKHYHKRKDQIYKKLGKDPMTLFQICRKVFSELPDDQRFLALSETQGHLDLLLIENKVTIEEIDGITYYVKG